MKSYHFIFSLFVLFFCGACLEDDDISPPIDCDDPADTWPTATLLQIDYQTLTFEGGHRFYGNDARYDLGIPQDSFPAEVIYNPPGDFGDLTVRLLAAEEARDTLFFGTIVWAGTGDRQSPATLSDPMDFELLPAGEEIPELATSLFDLNFGDVPEGVSETELYNAIANLQEVQEAQQQSGTRFAWFWYPRSVGVGDPAEWDYYFLILRQPYICE